MVDGLLNTPRHPQGDGASQWSQYDAEQPDKHPPGSASSGSAASCRAGLATQCLWSEKIQLMVISIIYCLQSKLTLSVVCS